VDTWGKALQTGRSKFMVELGDKKALVKGEMKARGRTVSVGAGGEERRA
jgi:hypothetical protein